MASIEKRGDNSWRLTVEVGYDEKGRRKRKRKTIKVEDKRLLRAPKRLKEHLEMELAKFKIEVEAGEYIAPEKTKLEDFVTEWRDKYASNPENLSPSTLDTYENHLRNHILPRFGHMRLDQIKTKHIIDFLDDLKKPGARKDGNKEPLASGTIVVIYRALKNVLRIAKEWGMIKENPMKEIKKPKEEYQSAKYYDSEEADQAIRCLFKEKSRMWRLICLGALVGGLRRGEILALKWSDVNFEENTIFIDENIPLMRKGKAFVKKPKSEASIASVKMPEWYMDELKLWRKEWLEERMLNADRWEGGDEEFIFHAGTGKPIYYSQPTKWWKNFCNRHGLKYIRFHDLRHSTATLLLEEDVPLKAIQQRLRHSRYQTTADLYTHVTRKVDEETTSKFDKFDPRKKNIQ